MKSDIKWLIWFSSKNERLPKPKWVNKYSHGYHLGEKWYPIAVRLDNKKIILIEEFYIKDKPKVDTLGYTNINIREIKYFEQKGYEIFHIQSKLYQKNLTENQIIKLTQMAVEDAI